MQQDADFITADFLYMFRASSVHHQEYKILKGQPPVQIVLVASRRCFISPYTIMHGNTKLKFRLKMCFCLLSTDL